MNKNIIKMLDCIAENSGTEQLIDACNTWLKKNNPSEGLKIGDRYYYIDQIGDICEETWRDGGFDLDCLWLGNIFLTEEDAEFEVERLKILKIMRDYSRPFKVESCNYVIHYDVSEGMIQTSYLRVCSNGLPVFESEKKAQQVIDLIGEDKLKKYWFGVEE